MKKLILLGFLSLFLINFTSAGLVLTEDLWDVNKTYAEPQFISLTLTNTENFKFQNIRSSDETIIRFDQFDLESGQNKTFQAEIMTNSDFNGSINLEGQYETFLGSSNKTEIVNIDYDLDQGVDKCNIELIKGDKIQWNNLVLDDVKIKNYDTGELVEEVLEGENYTKTFSYPEVFKYQIFRIGYPFTPICEINVLDDSGLVHSKSHDAELNLNIHIIYNPTSLETTFLSTSYEIAFNEEKEDIFSIRNTGSEIARTITLESDWITFNKNNFNLAPGDSTNIGYTISPFVFQTEETNKTHIKNITISGNFETITQEIEVFVPYKRLSADVYNGSYDLEFLDNFINYICSTNPELPACQMEQIYLGGLGDNVTAIYTQETIKEMIEDQIETNDKLSRMEKLLSEVHNDSKDTKQYVENSLGSIDENLDEVADTDKKERDGLGFIFVILLAFAIVCAMGYLSFKDQVDNFVMKTWHKGEKKL